MTLIDKLARVQHATASTVRLWLVFLACAAVATVVIAVSQRFETAMREPLAPISKGSSSLAANSMAMPRVAAHHPVPRIEFQPTFADAAESLRAGRFAEAYGRFVTLADEGDADAGRIALVMHRYGPEVFGSIWDASTEQLTQWTRWSEVAAHQELASRP
jgi:hypothetical protein